VSRLEYVTGFQARQVSFAIDFSVSAVFVGRIDWHPASEHIIASSNGSVDPLAMKDFQFIEHRLFDVEPFSPPCNEASELKDKFESSQPGHTAGLLAGNR
jgi:hypothetical protein